MPKSKTCPECGAVVPQGAEQCGLCGTSVAEEEQAAPDASEDPGASAAGVFCHACGWKNPQEANFCSRCGHELQTIEDETPPGPPAGAKPPAGPSGAEAAPKAAPRPSATPASGDAAGLGKRVAAVVAVAVLLVAGLFGWSAWSGSQAGSDASSAASAPMAGGGMASQSGGTGGDLAEGDVPQIIRAQQDANVPPAMAAQADSLQNVIETRSGRHKRLAHRQLARLFVGEGRIAQAAAQQWLLARESDSASAWEQAGSLLYDWMASLDRGPERAQVARLTVDAYERVLERSPDNNDVRTNLAVAYLDTNNPMRGISEIKRVLQEEPDHVGARFNYGLMQVMIGRHATAVTQFERVRATASPDSPYYEQAGQIIDQINEQTGGDPQDTPTPGQDASPMPSTGS